MLRVCNLKFKLKLKFITCACMMVLMLRALVRWGDAGMMYISEVRFKLRLKFRVQVELGALDVICVYIHINQYKRYFSEVHISNARSVID